jgi:hypothetical protein
MVRRFIARFNKYTTRLGYLRAAREMQRQGYPEFAAKLLKQAQKLDD